MKNLLFSISDEGMVSTKHKGFDDVTLDTSSINLLSGSLTASKFAQFYEIVSKISSMKII